MPQSIGNHNYQVFARSSTGEYSQPISISTNVVACGINNPWNHKFYFESGTQIGNTLVRYTYNGVSYDSNLLPPAITSYTASNPLPSGYSIQEIFKNPSNPNNLTVFGMIEVVASGPSGKIFGYTDTFPNGVGQATAGSIVYPKTVSASMASTNDFIVILTETQIARIAVSNQLTTVNAGLTSGGSPTFTLRSFGYPRLSTDNNTIFTGATNQTGSNSESNAFARINTSTGVMTTIPFTNLPSGLGTRRMRTIFPISATEGLAFLLNPNIPNQSNIFRFNLDTGAITDTEIFNGGGGGNLWGKHVVRTATKVYFRGIDNIYAYDINTSSLGVVGNQLGAGFPHELLMLSTDNQYLFYVDQIVPRPGDGSGLCIYRIDLLTGLTSNSAVMSPSNIASFRAGVAY